MTVGLFVVHADAGSAVSRCGQLRVIATQGGCGMSETSFELDFRGQSASSLHGDCSLHESPSFYTGPPAGVSGRLTAIPVTANVQ